MKIKWRNFKLLWQLIHDYKPTIILWMIVKILVSAIVPFIQILTMAKVIEWLTNGMEIILFIQNLSLWLIAVSILTSLEVFLKNKFDYFSETFRIQLIEPVISKQASLDYPLITGEEGSKKFWDAMMLLDYRGTSLGRIFDEWLAIGTAFFSVILYFYTLFTLEKNFLVVLVVVLVGLIALKRKQQRLKEAELPNTLKNWRQFNYLEKVIGDNRIAKDLRLYHMKGWFQAIKTQLSADYLKYTRSSRRHQSIENVFVSLALIMMTLLAYLRSIELISLGEIILSEFVVYVSVVTLITQTLMNLVNQLNSLNVSLTEVSAYVEFMNQAPVFKQSSTITVPKEVNEISFKNVSYTYSGNTVPTLNKISFTIRPDENIAIVGSNGAGKTTLIKLLIGLLMPDTGEIRINGIKNTEFAIKDLYYLFSPIFQESVAFTFTIRDAIINGSTYDEDKYLKVLKESGMDKIIDKLPNGDASHYVKEVHFDAVQLSGGQLQKLKMAQALYKDSAVLVLDEPTAALDPIAESNVYQSFEIFSKNKISIFISHRLASTRFCDRIFYLDDGKIIEAGTHQQLMEQKGKYFQLFETQAFYYREDIGRELKDQEGSQELGGVL